VIHFSRFEEPFLRHLHSQFTNDGLFPFGIICTHEIMRRLIPGLPRKGLRAVAGYFGHSVPESRRSAHHTTATAVIWREAVGLLEETQGIASLSELLVWLENTAPLPTPERFFPLDRRIRLGIPDCPGVYRMLRSNSDTLYVGKAKSLKHRVDSYFQKKRHHPEHILEMLTQVHDVDVTETGSSLEAALLESDEVKRLSPPYNIALRGRDRIPGFFSRDLMQFSPRSDTYHSIGPLPSRESLRPLSELIRLLEGGKDDLFDVETRSAVLGRPEEYTPETECFRDGFELFRQKYLSELEEKPLPRSLMALGRQLWKERLEELAAAETQLEEKITAEVDEDESEEDEEDVTVEWIWTPEAVAGSIESGIRHGAHLLRRARWLCLLSESSLLWYRRNIPDNMRTLIILEGGAVCHREDIAAGDEIPVPPGYGKSFRTRQMSFDLMTYDRLRVLTTELRRIISEDRGIELRLSPKSILGIRGLAGVLRWV
jgi:DNA polymerase-3 subunit epsilon